MLIFNRVKVWKVCDKQVLDKSYSIPTIGSYRVASSAGVRSMNSISPHPNPTHRDVTVTSSFGQIWLVYPSVQWSSHSIPSSLVSKFPPKPETRKNLVSIKYCHITSYTVAIKFSFTLSIRKPKYTNPHKFAGVILNLQRHHMTLHCHIVPCCTVCHHICNMVYSCLFHIVLMLSYFTSPIVSIVVLFYSWLSSN